MTNITNLIIEKDSNFTLSKVMTTHYNGFGELYKLRGKLNLCSFSFFKDVYNFSPFNDDLKGKFLEARSKGIKIIEQYILVNCEEGFDFDTFEEKFDIWDFSDLHIFNKNGIAFAAQLFGNISQLTQNGCWDLKGGKKITRAKKKTGNFYFISDNIQDFIDVPYTVLRF